MPRAVPIVVATTSTWGGVAAMAMHLVVASVAVTAFNVAMPVKDK